MKKTVKLWYEMVLPTLVLLAIIISSPILRLAEHRKLAAKYDLPLILSGPALLLAVIIIFFQCSSFQNQMPADAPFTATGAKCELIEVGRDGWNEYHLSKNARKVEIVPKKGYVFASYSNSKVMHRGRTKVYPGQYYIGPDPALSEAARPKAAATIYVY